MADPVGSHTTESISDICKTSTYLGKFILRLSSSLSVRWCRCVHLTLFMIPWSSGWIRKMQFEGKKCTFTLLSCTPWIWCTKQLPTSKHTFLPLLFVWTLNSLGCPAKILYVVHTLAFAIYCMGIVAAFFNNRGPPHDNKGHALVTAIHVCTKGMARRTLLCMPPLQQSPSSTRVLLGSIWKTALFHQHCKLEHCMGLILSAHPVLKISYPYSTQAQPHYQNMSLAWHGTCWKQPSFTWCRSGLGFRRALPPDPGNWSSDWLVLVSI